MTELSRREVIALGVAAFQGEKQNAQTRFEPTSEYAERSIRGWTVLKKAWGA
jgi:hypothetical protein